MKKTAIISVLMLTMIGHTQAQVSIDNYKYADETQLWRLTQNAAALSLDPEVCDSSANRGVTWFNLKHQEGNYHRVQEGGMNNHLEFYTERYQKIGKYLYGYGSFRFDMGRTKDRAWSDVLRSYNSNPFISGSSVMGKYDNQDFELNASLSTVQLGHFTYGASILYKVGDLSRLRDPRSRINLAEYRIAPSATYNIGSHSFGLTAHYDRRKEKLPSLTTVQTDASLAYYVMTGLENAEGSVGAYNGYMREYVNHEFGFELGYGIRQGSWKSVNALTLDFDREYVYGTYKYEPGTYRNIKYGLASRNRLQQQNILHSLDLTAAYERGSADEYKQEKITTKDPATGETSTTWNTLLTYNKRYQLKKTDLDLHYRLSFIGHGDVKGYGGIRYQLQNVSNKHILYTSELEYTTSYLELEGGMPVLHKHLWIEAQAGLNFFNKASIDLYDNTTDYAVGVLLPDMAYYRANYFRGNVQITYQMPLTIKGYTANWFAKLYASYLRSHNHLDNKTIGLAFGLYY